MDKKLKYLLISLGCSIVLCVGCGSKNNSEEGSIVENDEEKTAVSLSRKDLDWTEQLSDISIIKEQQITEARIYGYDENVYNTTDNEIIEEIINRIDELDVQVVNEEKEDVDGYSELFLLDNNKVVYHFLYTDYLYVGSNQYGPKDKAIDFYINVMGYCGKTFWK